MKKIHCPDPKSLREEYASGASARRIAERLGVCKRTVLQWMHEHGIERRDPQEASTIAKRTPEHRKRVSEQSSFKLPDKLIIDSYSAGDSVRRIAQKLNVAASVINRRLRRHGIESRGRYWKGDEALYGGLHARVRRRFGNPKKCSVCGATDPKKKYEWANLTGNYEDIDDYARMCVPCHRKHDRENNIGAYTAFLKKRSA